MLHGHWSVEQCEWNYLCINFATTPNEGIRNIIARSDKMNWAENYEWFFKRRNRFLGDLLKHDYNKVLMVCHGGSSQLLLEIVLPESEDISELDNCRTSIVKVRNNEARLIHFNNTSYLKK